MQRSKYNNKKITIDAHKFDSKAEANRYLELKMLLKAKVIDNLVLQPRFLLQDTFKDFSGKTQRKMEYIADFMYYDNEKKKVIVEDVKGMKTKEYSIKKKLFLYKYPELEFVEIGV